MEYQFVISEEQEGDRIDRFAASLLEDCSRSYLQKLIKDGSLVLNGAAVKPSAIIKTGDHVLINVPESVLPDIKPQDIPIDIVYEDHDIVIVNKPKGMVVHPAPGHYEGTLVNAIMYHCKDLSGINGVLRPGIVHRIDRDTTGLLVICKNDEAHQKIAAQFKTHDIERSYQAIALGTIKPLQSNTDGIRTIHTYIARDPKDRKRMAVVKAVPGNIPNVGKDAITHFSVLKQYSDMAHIECRLETGRTHQIRVHLSHIGHPLLGDEIYGARSTRFASKTQGQTLHAKTLGFVHPSTNEWISFDSELPAYFQEILRALEAPYI
ncbi:MAG: RluA family pseudouridine synthase [Lachnospiraceae bacterium]|nr:RluA family pseudouridine synthase [Lachnospiraceae bacterium]